jgi:hypothetical protein
VIPTQKLRFERFLAIVGVLGALSGCAAPTIADGPSSAAVGNLVICARGGYAGYGEVLNDGGAQETPIAFPGTPCQDLNIGHVDREISIAIYGLRDDLLGRCYLSTADFNPSTRGLTVDLLGTGCPHGAYLHSH